LYAALLVRPRVAYRRGPASLTRAPYSWRLTPSSSFARSVMISDIRFNRSRSPSVGGASAIDAKSSRRASLLSTPVG